MGSSPAFSASPPLSPTRQRRREQILQLANRRGWLAAPRAASVVQACHSAWKAGTLPEVNPIPSPTSREDIVTLSESDSESESVSELTASSAATSSLAAKQTPPIPERIDLLCEDMNDMQVNEGHHRQNHYVRRQSIQCTSTTSSEERTRQLHRLEERQMSRQVNRGQRILQPNTDLPTTGKQNRATGQSGSAIARYGVPSPRSSGTKSFDTPENGLGGRLIDEQCLPRDSVLRDRASAMNQWCSIPLDTQAHPNTTLFGANNFHDSTSMGNQFQGDRIAHRRTMNNTRPSVTSQGLKFSHQWLHPGPFDRTRDISAQRLLRLFDKALFQGELTSIPRPKVTVGWNPRLNRTAGITKMKHIPTTGERRAAIELSTKVIDEPERLYKTLAHELCHAGAWIIDATSKPPHGAVFKAWAQRFKNWDATLDITRCHDYEINYKYKYTCVSISCGQTYGRHSRSIDTTKKVCGICHCSLKLITAR